MAYDETLADRIRAAAAVLTGDVTERKMFGGLAFMLNGHMFAALWARTSCCAWANQPPATRCGARTCGRWTSPGGR